MENPFVLTISYWYNDNQKLKYTTLSKEDIFPLFSFSRKTNDLSLLTDRNISDWVDYYLSRARVDAYLWNFQKMDARSDGGLWWDFLIYKNEECSGDPIGVGSVDATLLDRIKDFSDDLNKIFQ